MIRRDASFSIAPPTVALMLPMRHLLRSHVGPEILYQLLGRAAFQSNGIRIRAVAGKISQLIVIQPEACSRLPERNEAQATTPKTMKSLAPCALAFSSGEW